MWDFNVRLVEHKNYIRQNDIQKSNIRRRWENGHRINWDSARILTRVR